VGGREGAHQPCTPAYSCRVMPTVSIITPFLNADAFISEAIASVRSQTFQDWELLLIDDGSTDGSVAIAKAAAAVDDRVRLVDHPANAKRGAAAARNAGLAIATGSFIAFLDADDLFNADKLEGEIALMEANPAAMMVYGPTRWWHPGEEHRDWVENMSAQANTLHQPPGLLADVLLLQKGEVPCTCGVLIRQNAIAAVGGFHEDFALYEDQTLWVKLFLRYPVVVSDVTRAVYRQHRSSVSAAASRSGKYDRFEPHSTRKAFLGWVADHVAASGLRYPEVERAIRVAFAAFPEHRNMLRVSDRARLISGRIRHISARSLRLAYCWTVRHVKSGIRKTPPS
jgi:glycosyltransferase involved in cell wall biosynthesis